MNYSAGTGAFYDQLPAVHNANGGCDLKGIDVLGHSVIQAAARYPYQPTTDVAPKLSEPVTKTVHSGFAKFLVAFPKGAGADNANARIVVAHAQDVDGRPERGEVVCFVNTSGHGSVAPYVYDGFNQRRFGPYDVSDSAPAEDEHHHDAVCMTTNAYGNAAVEVFESEQGKVDIVGYFTAERLLRDLLVDFAPPPAPEPVIAPPADANGNTAPAAAQSARALEAVGARKAPLRRARVRVRFVRLTTSASGRRALVVRLDGRGKARVRIRLFNARGRAVISVTRTLRAGRTVRITNLRITRALTRASVKVIG